MKKYLKKAVYFLVILAILLPLHAQAIMPVPFPLFHVTSPSTGMPLVGGLVWSFEAGGSTPTDTYTNVGLSVANTYPIVLDGDGNATIYIKQPTKLIIEGPPPVGQVHGTVLFTIDYLEVAPYNSYITIGATVPPTPGTNQLNLYCSGTSLYMVDSTGAVTAPATSLSIQQQVYIAAAGGGTGDAITATLSPALTSLVDKTRVCVWATAANSTTIPTFAPNGLVAKTIVKNNNQALAIGDIPGANYPLDLIYNTTLGKWILLNPVSPSAAAIHNVATVTLSGDSTKTLSSTLTSGNYLVVLNLTQNTSNGEPYITFNNDTGANYAWCNATGGGAQSGSSKNNIPLIYDTTTVLATSIWTSSFTLTCSGNNTFSDGTTYYVNNGSANVITMHGGKYAGAATLNRMDITTSAGTMTGTVKIYTLP